MKGRREIVSLLDRLGYRPDLNADFEFTEPTQAGLMAEVSNQAGEDRPPFDFRDHCLRLGGAMLGIFGILGLFGLLVGLAAFLIGVALPFGIL